MEPRLRGCLRLFSAWHSGLGYLLTVSWVGFRVAKGLGLASGLV